MDKVDVTTATSNAAILNNVVRFAADSSGDSPWASLDRYGRRPRRPRRLPVWPPDDSDDDGQHFTPGCYRTAPSIDDGVSDGADGYQETMLSTSLTSVQAVVEDFDDSSTEPSPYVPQTATTILDFKTLFFIPRSHSFSLSLSLRLEWYNLS